MTMKVYVEPLIEPYKNPFIFTGSSGKECCLQCRDLLNMFRAVDDEKPFHIVRCMTTNEKGIVTDIKSTNKDYDLFGDLEELYCNGTK